MVKTFNVDENNDLFIGKDGNLSIVTGLDAVLIACKQASQAQLGEMVLAINKGIPTFQTVWADAGTVAQFEAALRTTLLAVAGVTEVPAIDITIANNALRYTAEIKSIYGSGTIEGIV